MSDPIATPADLGTYLGVDINEDRATFILSLAQGLCESIVSPLPAGALAVVLDVAARGYGNPLNAQQQTAGPFSVGHGTVSGGMWLTRGNIAALRRSGGGGGAFTIDVMPSTAGQGLPAWDVNAAISAEDAGWYGGTAELT